MLALEHALSGYGGLTSLVLSSTLASVEEWVAEALRLRAELPAEVVATMERHEAAGEYDAPEYRAALDVFDDRYVRRGAIGRPELDLMKAGRGSESYRAMVGPNEWTVTGALRGWDVRDRLGEIAEPALVARGRYDMCTEAIAATLLAGLPDAREVVFEESSPHARSRGERPLPRGGRGVPPGGGGELSYPSLSLARRASSASVGSSRAKEPYLTFPSRS